ncbi:VPS10 domain-containing protein [Aurantibacillus circumpalustris]|uniref:VPS10 domain-containing protein n=1 Tax=Aurantibacillus circumpalustris TaxID=3036359 RepID=UPI00295A933F|nr:T9SS type A sorting domain-containing protein [Aurantibacillus circumpalustris]
MKFKFYLPFLFLINNLIFGQSWAEKMHAPDANFYEIQQEFNQYWLAHDKDEKGKGYKAFKRWENFVERRVYPSGDLSLLHLTPINYEKFLKQEGLQQTGPGKVIGNGGNLIASTTWTAMGPFGPLTGNAGGQFLKAGRIGFITFDPTNANTLWVGTPAGGLWKSTNSGTSWTTNTDNLSVLGCSDLAIDPTNTSIMYLATGDGDAGDTRSIGVLKTTNGGSTWSATGLTNPVSTNFLIRRLIINPSNTQIILAACNTGIYRTINGGTNWTQVSTSNCYDLEFKPGDPTTIYAGGTSLRISTNSGSSFTQITSGITTAAGRMAVAVTANDPNYVYVLASDNSTNGFLGLYRSTSSGTTFSLMSSTPNILNSSNNGSGTGGQGWYDLCIAVSPLNKDEVVTGGVNVWRSLDGGSNWSIYGHWTGSGAPFTHADQHDLEYTTIGDLYNTNDGTVYKRNSTGWTEISGSMNISQIYKIGLSSQTANKWITGHQDNGTSIWNGTSYNAMLGGDGMDCFYDRTNDNNVFGEYQNGALRRSTNGGASWSSAVTGLTGTPGWVTPWKQDPQTANTIYVGYNDLFKSTNLGVSWTQLTAMPATGTIREFAVAPSNSLVIYVLKSNGVYKTINGGTSWSNVTSTLPVSSLNPEFVSIDPLDPNNAWVVFSGYSNGNKVFVTSNGGSSWTNVSSNLPNIPANCCVYEPGSNDRIYVGMDVGIYYRDNGSSTWTLYNAGLPNTPIADLEISPASPTLLHAATYGRGVWVVNLATSATAPVSNFAPPLGGICAGSSSTFTDQSSGSPTAWSWSVSPSAGVVIGSQNSQNPIITFPGGGNYTVSIQASNVNGSGTVYSQILSISNVPNLVVSSSAQSVCAGSSVIFSASGANIYSWSNGGGASSTATYSPLSSSVYTVTGTSVGCSASKTISVIVIPNSTISISGSNAICAGDVVSLTASGASTYTWSNATSGAIINVSPTVTTTYSVTGASGSSCKPTASTTILVNPLPDVLISSKDTVICLYESISLNVTGALSYTWNPGGPAGSSLTFTPAVTTTYYCTGVDANGCSKTSAFTASVSFCSGEKTLLLNKTLYSIFPNPTKGKLTLATSSSSEKAMNLEVMDVSGKIVFKQQLSFTNSEKQIDINISELSSGTYFIKLVSEKEVSTQLRIIKE